MQILSKTTYNEILTQLRKTSNWLSDKAQINTSGTRFEAIYSNVQQITEKFECGTLETLIEEKGNEDLWLSLTESDAFIRIFTALKHIESAKLPRRALKLTLGGPLLPREETPNTAQSRNILFELELAARFHEAGISIIGFDDIKLYFDGNHIGVQCKRPFSKKGVRDNLRSAKEQIRKRHSAISQGMIAFAIDKIYETDRKILVVNNQSEIRQHVTWRTNDFIERNKNDWHHILNTRIIGILICMKYICHIKDINLLTTGFQLDIYDRGISGYDGRLLRKIKNKFAKIYQNPIMQ